MDAVVVDDVATHSVLLVVFVFVVGISASVSVGVDGGVTEPVGKYAVA